MNPLIEMNPMLAALTKAALEAMFSDGSEIEFSTLGPTIRPRRMVEEQGETYVLGVVTRGGSLLHYFVDLDPDSPTGVKTLYNFVN